MKIVNQTTDNLTLKDGNAQGVIIGIILAIIGISLVFNSHPVVSTALWVALALFIIGILLILLSSTIIVAMDKTSGQITYQTKRLAGGKIITRSIADVMRVETRKSWRIENNNNNRQTVSMPRQVLELQSIIVFKDGQELPLDHQNSGSNLSIGPAVMMAGSGKEVSLANQVAAFLGVPFQEIAPPAGGVGINLGSIGGINLKN